MKKKLALLLALLMLAAICLTACKMIPFRLPFFGRPDPPPIEHPEPPAPEPDEPDDPPAPQEPDEPDFDDMVGIWYLESFRSASDGEYESFGWEAADVNVDARIVFGVNKTMDYTWGTPYDISEYYEGMICEIVQEPATEGYDLLPWCVQAANEYGNVYRVGFTEEGKLLCYEKFVLDEEDFVYYIGIYTKDGPVEFRPEPYSYEDLTWLTWYQYDLYNDDEYSSCYDTFTDCQITLYNDYTADYYYYTEGMSGDAIYLDSVPVQIVNRPLDSEDPLAQDWHMVLEGVPYGKNGLRSTIKLTVSYDGSLMAVISTDGVAFSERHASFYDWSPLDMGGMDYYEFETPPSVQALFDAAAEDQWLITVCDPSEEMIAECEERGILLNEPENAYKWSNPKELLICPTTEAVYIEVNTGRAIFAADGSYEDWEADASVYFTYLYPGEVYRCLVDMPYDPEDATLCLYMDFIYEGAYTIRIFEFDSDGDPYLYF